MQPLIGQLRNSENMKNILVPTDFSVPSRASFKFALDVASKAHADVYVLHMIELSVLHGTTFGIQPYPLKPDVLQKGIVAARRSFEAMKKLFPSNVPVHFHTFNDSVVSGMRAFIEDYNIDLVVMSTHGTSDQEEFLLGSTAEKIVRFSTIPVLSIPTEIKLDSVKSIVFPTDLDMDQDDLMKDLKDLQQLLNAKLHVLLVNTPFNFHNEGQARKSLAGFAKHYALNDFTLNFRNHQFERSGILEFLNEIDGHMIAMATHGRTGLRHFFKGSIAEAVLKRIDHPIWTWNLNRNKQIDL